VTGESEEVRFTAKVEGEYGGFLMLRPLEVLGTWAPSFDARAALKALREASGKRILETLAVEVTIKIRRKGE
jgi:hypothetical protein